MTDVFFDIERADFTVNSPTQITATVPNRATTGPVTVVTFGGRSASSGDFNVAAPAISNFTPSSGIAGAEVVITGINFNGTFLVLFNGAPVLPQPLDFPVPPLEGFRIDSPTQITVFEVPDGATTGPIFVLTPGGIAVSGTNFTVGQPPPTITNVNPGAGKPGDAVQLTGTNLTNVQAVLFNGVPVDVVNIVELTDTKLLVTIPAGATTGPITVVTPGGSVQSGNFTVTPALPPSITGFAPAGGSIGSGVVITGLNFTGATDVLFNGARVDPFEFTVDLDTQITVFSVPVGAQTGPLTVITPGGVTTSSTSFTVIVPPILAPTIQGFTPGSGPIRTTVIITGTNLTGAEAVTIGGVAVPLFFVDADTQITATVPVNAVDGPIAVVTPGGIATSAASFIVTPTPPPTITSFSPGSASVGTQILITGANFTDAEFVYFNGLETVFEVLSPTQILAQAPLAATSGPISVRTAGGTVYGNVSFLIPAPVVTGISTSSGPLGTRFIITGNNFQDGTTFVTFNGIPLTPDELSVDSPTQLTVIAVGAGPIQVNTPSGSVSAGNFVITPSGPPTITGFTPRGTVGDSIVITGSNLLTTFSVTFNGVATPSSTISVDSASQLTVVVPPGAGTGRIVVMTSLGTATSSTDFTVDGPTITALTPASASIGSTIIISGTNFTGATAVTFNGILVTPYPGSASGFSVDLPTQIRVTVPAGATTGPISVITSAGIAISSGNFTVLPFAAPTISSLSSSNGVIGSTLFIFGTNLLAGGAPIVTINGTPTALLDDPVLTLLNSDTELIVAIPPGATSGPVRVTTAGGVAASPGNFTVAAAPAPVISTFTPGNGAAGDAITVFGSNFSGASVVLFNGVPVLSNGPEDRGFEVISPTIILVMRVPTGASTGPITVITPGGRAVSAANFIVAAPVPTITGFTPGSGAVGASVIIAGTGFAEASLVVFNGAEVVLPNILVRSDTELSVTVPLGATTGPIKVVTPGGTATSAGIYTVTPSATPTIAGFTPGRGQIGSSVVITGTNLLSASAVLFGGVPVDYLGFTVTSPTEIVVSHVPREATTGPITVVTPGGVATSAGSFTVTALPPPTFVTIALTAFKPDDEPSTTIAAVISGTGFVDVGMVLFNNTPVFFTVASPTRIDVPALPAGAAAGTFEIVAAGGAATSLPFVVPLTPAPTITGFTPGAGAAGSLIVITGTHLTGATAVTINGVRVPPSTHSLIPSGFIVNSDTQIMAIVPPDATSGLVTVVTPSGIAISSSPFTATPPAAPTLVSTAPATAAVSDTVTLSGTNLDSVIAVTFNGAAAITFQALSSTELAVQVPVGATSGPVVVTTPSGKASIAFSVTLPGPTISSLSTSSAAAGDTVIISGTGLSRVTQVSFGFIPVGPLGFTIDSPTQITATVPIGATTGLVVVRTPDGTEASALLTVTPAPAPTITGLSPDTAPVGGVVVITGTNFTSASVVTFNGAPADSEDGLILVSPTELRVKVPAAATSGPLAVTTAGGTASSPFTVAAPTISSIASVAGPVGATVIITGTNFGGVTAVKFNGVKVAPTNIVVNSPTQILAKVPQNATSGPISVTTPGGTAASAPFVVTASPVPTLAAPTPTSGAIGDTVVLTGSGLTSATAVFFNGASAQYAVNSDRRITATVPVGATTGTVTVATPGGVALSSAFSVVPAPLSTITGFTPSGAAVGAKVIIIGTNFTNVTAVRFDGVDVPLAEITVESTTQLSVPVPRGATSGTIAVVTPAGVALSPGTFTVNTALAPTITNVVPSFGPPGTAMTIVGSHFSGAGSVSFGGRTTILPRSIDPQGFVVLSDTQIALTVPWTATTGLIAVTTPGGTATSAAPYTLPASVPPTILSFTPSGMPGAAVSIGGTNFLGPLLFVQFNGVFATEVAIIDSNTLIAKVPSGATTGPITVQTQVGTASSRTAAGAPADFIVLPAAAPTIDAFSLQTGPVGTLVRISGSNLAGVSSVLFNGVQAQFRYLASALFNGVSQGPLVETVVPAGAATGAITLSTPGGTATSLSAFTVLPSPAPIITGFTPTSSEVFPQVAVTGYGFFGTTSVTFNGVPANFTVTLPVNSTGFGFPPELLSIANATQIITTVPSEATTGPIAVTTPGGTTVTSTDFIIPNTPVVDGFFPSSGYPGQKLLINGSRFIGVSAVAVNGVRMGFTVLSDAQISALVPAAATSGPISVTTATGTATSSAVFIVLPAPILTVPNPGSAPIVTFANPATGQTFTITAFDPNFTGGVRTAVGDFNADGTPDLVVGAGPGGGPNVRVFDGRTGAQISGPLGNFFAFDPNFTGGVYVAAGDLNGDFFDDLIVSADRFGGPNVVVFSGMDGTLLYNFFAFAPTFTGGVRLAVGDVTGNGLVDIIVGAGPGGGPNVRVFDGTTGEQISGPTGSFFAFDPNFTGGVFVAAGNLTGAAHADLIVGAGSSGGPNVASFDGVTGATLTNFFAYEAFVTDGVRVASLPLNGRGQIITGLAPNGSQLHAFDGTTAQQIDEFFVGNPAFNSGVFQGSSA